MARAFADLVKEMWSGNESSTAPTEVKRAVGQVIFIYFFFNFFFIYFFIYFIVYTLIVVYCDLVYLCKFWGL